MPPSRRRRRRASSSSSSSPPTAAAGSTASARGRSPSTSDRWRSWPPRAHAWASRPTPSARARATWLEEIGAYAGREGLVLHVHADEQPREIEECLAEHGLRPVELLAESGCLGPRTTIVHGTHADERELDLLAEFGTRVCLCPTTEANLGDGFPPLEGLLARGIPLCIGSDSNVRIDPLEELREIEGMARRQQLRRNVIAVERLLDIGAGGGAAALGLDDWPGVEVDLEHDSLRGVQPDDVPAALVHGCAADVLV